MIARLAARLALLLATMALLVVVPAPSANAADVRVDLFVPGPEAWSLLPADFGADADEELAAASERLSDADDPVDVALLTFAVERAQHLADVRARPADLRADLDPGAPIRATHPDHSAALALLQAITDEQLDELDDERRAELLLARAIARSTAERRSIRVAATDDLAAAVELIAPGSPLRTPALLAMALHQGRDDQAREAGDLLDAVDDTADAGPYDLMLTWERARLADQRAATATAEKLWYAFLEEARDVDRLESLDPALLDHAVLQLARAGAGREEGWVRVTTVLHRLPLAAMDRLRERLVQVYDDGGLPMNRARVRLWFAAEIEEWADFVDTLVAVVDDAERIGGLAASHLCIEAFEAIDGRATGPIHGNVRVEELARRCLIVQRTVPRDRDRPEDVLAFYEVLGARFDDLFEPLDHALYGRALFDNGETSEAAEHLLQVDVGALPEDQRRDFARTAADLRHGINTDIHLANASCTLRRAQPLPVEDVRYRDWLARALIDETDDADRFELMRRDLAILVINGHYEDAAAAVEPLVLTANAAGKGLLATDRVAAFDALVGCFATAGRWHEIVSVTPTLRRYLDESTRDAVFDVHGDAITEAWLDLANAMDIAGDTDQAVEMLQEMQRVWRDNARATEVLFMTGAMLGASGELREAVIYYEQIYTEHPHDALADDALFAAAMALRAEGDDATARRLLERVRDEYTTGEFPLRAREILDQMGPAPEP